MPTATQVDRWMTAEQALQIRATNDLMRIIDRIDPAQPVAARNALLEAMPALIEKYGAVMAVVAADFFDDLITGDVYIPGFKPPAAYWASTRNAVTPLFKSGNMAATTTALVGALQRHILQPARETIMESARRTPGVAYARMLRGDKNCAFCTVMAGRGAVYSSEPLAGDLGKRFNDYHDHCDCRVIPIRNERDWPKGYDHERVEKLYKDALDESNTTILKGGEPLFKKDSDGKLVPTGARRDSDSSDYSVLEAMRDKYGLK